MYLSLRYAIGLKRSIMCTIEGLSDYFGIFPIECKKNRGGLVK